MAECWGGLRVGNFSFCVLVFQYFHLHHLSQPGLKKKQNLCVWCNPAALLRSLLLASFLNWINGMLSQQRSLFVAFCRTSPIASPLVASSQLLLNWSHAVASDRQLTCGNVRLAGSEPTESSHPWSDLPGFLVRKSGDVIFPSQCVCLSAQRDGGRCTISERRLQSPKNDISKWDFYHKFWF